MAQISQVSSALVTLTRVSVVGETIHSFVLSFIHSFIHVLTIFYWGPTRTEV